MRQRHPCGRTRRRPERTALEGGVEADGGAGVGTGLPASVEPAQLDSPQRQAEAERLLEVMRDLAGAGNAVALRIARLCAWIKTVDPADCGYPSHRALFRECVAVGDSWLRDLIRLVESELPLVLAAVCRGELSLTVAVKAAGAVSREEQVTWLEQAKTGGGRGLPRRPQVRRFPPVTVRAVSLERTELRDIHRARQLAGLLAGRSLPASEADFFILDSWRRRVDGRDLVARAKADPPVPAKRIAPKWCGLPDPATPLLGVWVQPRDLPHALHLLEQAQVAQRSRVVLLGQAFDLVASKGLHHEMGFSSLAELAAKGLRMSVRQLERHRALARELRILPLLAEAIDDGLDLARARLVATIAEEATVGDWLDIARHTGIAELRRAVKLAGRSTRSEGEKLVHRYQRAIQVARDVVPATDAATDTGSPSWVRVAVYAAWVPDPVPSFDRVHVNLPEAARWFLRQVKLERQHGFARVKERDRYTCRNPECGRRSLRVQAHHIVFRQDGGGDELDNGITLCPVCHLRLVHTGRISVQRVGRALVWLYPGRMVVAL